MAKKKGGKTTTRGTERMSPEMVAARRRGFRLQREMFHAYGGCMDGTEVADWCGIDQVELARLVETNQIFWIHHLEHSDMKMYPRWQFEPHQATRPATVLTGLPEVLAALRENAEVGPEQTGWSKMGFFLQADSLTEGLTPLQALIMGKVADAVTAARGLYHHGVR